MIKCFVIYCLIYSSTFSLIYLFVIFREGISV